METPSLDSMDAARRERLAHGFKLLIEAAADAAVTNRKLRDCAVSVDALIAAGLNENDLGYVLMHRLAAHVVEKFDSRRKRRTLVPEKGIRLYPDSCFSLTASGQAFAQSLNGKGVPQPRDEQSNQQDVPQWSEGKRILRWRNQVVLTFEKVVSPYQEGLLTAFQAQKWSRRIDTPPGWSNNRLAEAIRELNARLGKTPLRFRRDGTGKGVVWTVDETLKQRPTRSRGKTRPTRSHKNP